MPFTVSHAAAVLPFLRTPLPAAALVVGSMAPDLPYFLPLGIPRAFSHSWLGLVTIDLVIGLIVVFAWWLLLRAPVLDYAPGWLRDRMPERRLGSIAWMLVALIVGGATHLVLDTVTHEGSLDVVIPFMAERLGLGLSVSNVVHGVFSIVGAVILAVWVRRWVIRTPRRYTPAFIGENARAVTWISLGTVFGAVAVGVWLYGMSLGSFWYEQHLLFVSFSWGVAAVAAIAVVLCAAWHVRRRIAGRALVSV
jgi:hypothetical protein